MSGGKRRKGWGKTKRKKKWAKPKPQGESGPVRVTHITDTEADR